jgi:hypothetical protein
MTGRTRTYFESAGKEDHHVVDDIRGAVCFVAFGDGEFLHDGWFHSHPVGLGHRCDAHQAHPGPKSHRLTKEWTTMKPIMIAGIVLVVLGALALAYQGINYTRQEDVINIGPIHATADREERIPLPPILGGLALVGGIVLLVTGAKKTG